MTARLLRPPPRGKQLETAGLKVVPLDFKRASMNPFAALVVLWRLIVALRRERPDIVHFLALKPILVGGLAALFVPKVATVFHLTGLGYLAAGKTRKAALVRNLFLRLLALYLKRRKSWLIVENPDDLATAGRFGVPTGNRASVLGGAGIDPLHFIALAPKEHTMPRAAFVGRMVWSKGVDVLIEAMDELAKRGVDLEVDLFGAPDIGNPRAIHTATLRQWNQRPGVKLHGATSDVRRVWRVADIAVFPSRGGEGLPRSLLEAAACARALIVTDVPGCRHFVRHGIEGLVVPPEDSAALAGAIEKLALDPELRRRMGRAARQRVLDGYTERHVRQAITEIYATLLAV
ncbi:MAG: glycosyltransferase family 4 protein [Alphaproteobacteria bacterium]|nr:glycosyltransferase family 4 protein [Alphaproteobacteria bacterium]